MTNYRRLQSMPKEKLAEWLSKNCYCDNSPWAKWMCNKYCENCPTVKVWSKYFGQEVEVSLCEKGECPHGVDGIAEDKLILMWLEAEDTEQTKSENCIYEVYKQLEGERSKNNVQQAL